MGAVPLLGGCGADPPPSFRPLLGESLGPLLRAATARPCRVPSWRHRPGIAGAAREFGCGRDGGGSQLGFFIGCCWRVPDEVAGGSTPTSLGKRGSGSPLRRQRYTFGWEHCAPMNPALAFDLLFAASLASATVAGSSRPLGAAEPQTTMVLVCSVPWASGPALVSSPCSLEAIHLGSGVNRAAVCRYGILRARMKG